MKQLDPDLTTNLAYFIGDPEPKRYSALFKQVLITEGAAYLAEKAGAYWLLDLISSYQPGLIRKGYTAQTWILEVKDREGKAICRDGRTGKWLRTQKIPYTDFPLDEIKLFANFENGYTTIMLPNEY